MRKAFTSKGVSRRILTLLGAGLANVFRIFVQRRGDLLDECEHTCKHPGIAADVDELFSRFHP